MRVPTENRNIAVAEAPLQRGKPGLNPTPRLIKCIEGRKKVAVRTTKTKSSPDVFRVSLCLPRTRFPHHLSPH